MRLGLSLIWNWMRMEMYGLLHAQEPGLVEPTPPLQQMQEQLEAEA